MLTIEYFSDGGGAGSSRRACILGAFWMEAIRKFP